jgi:hypothetical protein
MPYREVSIRKQAVGLRADQFEIRRDQSLPMVLKRDTAWRFNPRARSQRLSVVIDHTREGDLSSRSQRQTLLDLKGEDPLHTVTDSREMCRARFSQRDDGMPGVRAMARDVLGWNVTSHQRCRSVSFEAMKGAAAVPAFKNPRPPVFRHSQAVAIQ